jgi:CubicO group peptidase (beta-lactamase class C family)
LFKDYVEKQYKKPLDKLDNDLYYTKIGAKTLGYNPLERFKKSRILPTEKDDYYRHQLLQGYVHDMGAAMFGGVGGNAGLFGGAEDVAKMMQLYLQKGEYGGEHFFSTKTFDTFNKRYFEKDSVRRGLAFDKPQLNPKITATCGCVSSESFGHSGFTGTFTWADPKTNLIYVFLSNRVYPTMKNNKLGKENIRTEVQAIIQNAILDKKQRLIAQKKDTIKRSS